MKTWITKDKNIMWKNNEEFYYFYDAFWNPPPLHYEEVENGWMILE